MGRGPDMRIAVVGLYNSGSTALAGMLHRLGANMGRPYWGNSDPNSRDNFYEPYDLSWHLRNWWNEPQIEVRVDAAHRISFLKHWIELQECLGSSAVGAKHPLLSLCIGDLVDAWGVETRIVWSYRTLTESIAGLTKRGWFRGYEQQIQQHLWGALQTFKMPDVCLLRLNWAQVKEDPAWAARELARFADLTPSAVQLRDAAAFVRRTTDSVGPASRLGRNPPNKPDW